MNRDNARLYIPLLQALANGKTLQFRPKGEDIAHAQYCREKWTGLDRPEVEFFYPPDRYRVKPEPKKLYAVICPDGTLFCAYEFKAAATYAARNLNRAQRDPQKHEVITFVGESQ